MNLAIKDILYVALQLLLFLAYLFNFNSLDFTVSNMISGVALALCILGSVVLGLALLQLNTNLSPFPSPKSSSKLVTVGLYKYVRHPIYTGIVLIMFNFGIHMGSTYKVSISVAILILFYFKSRYEEQKLIKKFEAYNDYIKETGRFFPKL